MGQQPSEADPRTSARLAGIARTYGTIRKNKRLATDVHRLFGPFAFTFFAVVLGVVAGFGAFVFRVLIALFHNLFLLGRISVQYDTGQHTPVGLWGPGVALSPAIGAILVVFLVKRSPLKRRGMAYRR